MLVLDSGSSAARCPGTTPETFQQVARLTSNSPESAFNCYQLYPPANCDRTLPKTSSRRRSLRIPIRANHPRHARKGALLQFCDEQTCGVDGSRHLDLSF